MKKGFTLMEIMFVILILAILSSLAIPMYDDYSRRSRAAEIPSLLKSIVQLQIAWKETPESGDRYATDIATIEWTTSTETNAGSFYYFGTHGVEGCDPGVAADLLPVGLAEAWAIDPAMVAENWVTACMDIDLDILANTE